MSETTIEEYTKKMRGRYARLTGRKLWSRWRNLFCVTMKQESKRREGSRQIRRHEKQGRTPARRLIDSGQLRKEEERKLESQMETINPFVLRKEIRGLEDRLWSRREELYQAGREALALADVPPQGLITQPETKSPECPNNEATVLDDPEAYSVLDL